MRIKHFFGLAVLAAMTASCSSNNDLVNGGNGSGENESGVSYASFTINLPTTRGTRADDPTFDKGDATEYDVFNATLLVFKKGTTAGEGNYTFAEKVDLGSMEPWKNPNETGVTTQAKITAKLSYVDKSGDYFALVLLNNGSDTDPKVTLPSEGNTFSAWNVATNATNITDTKKGFYMANAPLYNATDKSVTTLVPIKKENIFPTEAQASSGDAAADIYVERGLAKVTLTTATKYGDVGGSTYVGDKVEISNWALDVTNKKTFPIHNVDGLTEDYAAIWNNDAPTTPGASNKRFVDNNELTKAKRVYWGVDPNYKENTLCDLAETTAREKNFNYIKKEKLTAKPTDPLYCLENTFNLENMKQGQTTRVIFKASYTPKDFTEGDGKTFFKVGTSVALWKKKDLEDHIKAAVSKVFSVTTTDDITINLAAKDNDITAAGNHVITAANFTVKGHDTVTKAEEKAVNDKVGLTEKAGISTYANGESYYIARIKHFGDDLTPWNSGETYNDNLKYLGRYGMLRNNWYVLNVQSVSGPGYPDVPEVKPNTPDDEDDKYIKVSVKILDWAKRSQNVDL
ncbi:Mfa1 family fimbria major subunit [Prevotella copri]|uniref:Mfa1 family fimbria major subunit n=2 Tax=Segatella copri TaxID=165179 RepID=A0AAW5ILH7_9BACT|nr:Mfa1 family fimbria major subunit [Segatella copri]MCP9541281.1 Mfa1 family fimbria major subunit [Segatella copri]MCP9565354.1 Mfa1 family fimbria major subunit [Segatella copri]